jgi:hypothetical protein
MYPFSDQLPLSINHAAPLTYKGLANCNGQLNLRLIRADNMWQPWALELGAKDRNEVVRTYGLTKLEANDLKKSSRRIKQNQAQRLYLQRQLERRQLPGKERCFAQQQALGEAPKMEFQQPHDQQQQQQGQQQQQDQQQQNHHHQQNHHQQQQQQQQQSHQEQDQQQQGRFNGSDGSAILFDDAADVATTAVCFGGGDAVTAESNPADAKRKRGDSADGEKDAAAAVEDGGAEATGGGGPEGGAEAEDEDLVVKKPKVELLSTATCIISAAKYELANT